MEKLTRLNPKTTSLNPSGGKSELTTADIAAACANANAIGMDILLTKICGQRRPMVPLFYEIYRMVIDEAIKGGWKSPKGSDRLRSLTQLAIYETVNEMACPTCKGRKFSKQAPTKACGRCNGTGIYRIEGDIRADALGVSRAAWYKTWASRYEIIRKLVKDFADEHEYQALKSIRKLLT